MEALHHRAGKAAARSGSFARTCSSWDSKSSLGLPGRNS